MAEEVDLLGVVFSAPGRRERAYAADEVDLTLREAQVFFDNQAAELSRLENNEEELQTALNRIQELETANANLNEQLNASDEHIGQLEAANKELRAGLEQALEAEKPVNVAEQASVLLQRAAELANNHIAEAKAQAENIVSHAHESLHEVTGQIEEARHLRDAAIAETSKTLSAHLQNLERFKEHVAPSSTENTEVDAEETSA